MKQTRDGRAIADKSRGRIADQTTVYYWALVLFNVRWVRAPIGTLVLVFGLCLSPWAYANASSQIFHLQGVAKDPAGASIAKARVVFNNLAFTVVETTDGDGRFGFDVPAQTGTLVVQAQGFKTFERKWSAQDPDAAHLEIVLAPEPILEQVTVTATRTEERLSDTAASVVVLTREDLSTAAAMTLDDTLRQVPGFTLFRRSGSRTANPTSQGVSLRGVGASGASRAVVLADGIPLNDPFGGWIAWGRVPRESVSKLEVLRGGASHLYGTDALGGAINLITREPASPTLSLETSYGSQRTPSASLFTGGRKGPWGAQLSAEAFHTDGYVIVDERDRGRIDTPAGSERTTVNLTLDRLLSDRGRIFVRGLIFGESRKNGTPLQRNRTHIRQFAFGGDWRSERLGEVSIRGYGGTQVFDQIFSIVSVDRNRETLTRSQRVPAQQIGFMGQWSHDAGPRQTFVIGLDARAVRGASDELLFSMDQLTGALGVGGRQTTIGVFAEDIVRITSRWFVTAGARVDNWRNHDALSTFRPLSPPQDAGVTTFPLRTETALSPRLSVLHKVNDDISLTASGYRAFRAPSLNELYRPFQVGNVLTLANDSLRAERLTGGEAGANVTMLDKRLSVRGVFFWSEITRPITNVTLSVRPGFIRRRRDNLGRTRSRGIELDTVARLSPTLTISGGYQFADATVLRFPSNTVLEGLLIPQVPRHQLTFQTRYTNPSRIIIGAQVRFAGAQFDDDLNRFRLDRYVTVDALAMRPLGRSVELFAAAENLLNQRYAIGRTPFKTIGPPFFIRFGLRLHIGLR